MRRILSIVILLLVISLNLLFYLISQEVLSKESVPAAYKPIILISTCFTAFVIAQKKKLGSFF